MKERGKSGRSIGSATPEVQRYEELRRLEEVLTRLKEENFDKAARSCKAATGVDRDQFRPQVPVG